MSDPSGEPVDFRRWRDAYKVYAPAKRFTSEMERLMFQMAMQPKEIQRELEMWTDVEKAFEELINATWENK